jgi:hypothetical protein
LYLIARGENVLSSWISKELKGGRHYPGGEGAEVEGTLRDLNSEFKTIHGELSEKVFKVAKAPAKKIAEKYNVPLYIALVACQIELDGILPEETACKLLQREYLRLGATDYAIPPIDSAELDFSVKEGKWIEYLYKKFSRQINDKTGTMTTLENMLKSTELPTEKILVIVDQREKITRGLISPILREWVSTHRKATAFLGALVMAEAILKSPNELEKQKPLLTSKIEEVRGILNRLISGLESSDFSSLSSREIEPVKREINHLKESLSQMDSPVESMSETGLAELIAQLIPTRGTPPAPLEKGSYVIVTSPTPKSGELKPLLDDPYDFLERDIRLAARRDDSASFMLRTVEKVHRVLAGDKNPPIEVALEMVMRMSDRFGETPNINKDEMLAKLNTFVSKEQIGETGLREKIDIKSLYKYVADYFLENFSRPQNTKPAGQPTEEKAREEQAEPAGNIS